MAPDRGEHDDAHTTSSIETDHLIHEFDQDEEDPTLDAGQQQEPELAEFAELSRSRSELGKYCADDAVEGHSFTVRGLILGLIIGILVCFSNTFFGLQSGWISGMTMPASLIGFAFFKAISRHLTFPFSPVENVLVQTVAGAVGTMPLGSGFVGVVPALEYLLTPDENGPLKLSLGKLVVWSLGLSFFGVVFGVPLRKQVILKEELKFPSGTATALMIGVLHGGRDGDNEVKSSCSSSSVSARHVAVEDRTDHRASVSEASERRGLLGSDQRAENEAEEGQRRKTTWKYQIRLLTVSFLSSGIYTLVAYFIPQLRRIPFLGRNLAINWLWTFNLSPAYAAQGIIMGPATTSHMLLGAIIGWGVLSPLAKRKGWAPGPVKDWDRGSRGWIVWVSLAIMLSDSLVSLGWLVGRPLLRPLRARLSLLQECIKKQGLWTGRFIPRIWSTQGGYTPIDHHSSGESTALMLNQSHSSQLSQPANTTTTKNAPSITLSSKQPLIDAPPDQLISNRTVLIGLFLSLIFCIISIHITFPHVIPIHATLLAVLMALLLSIMGVRALGETDLNPVSGISKLTQLVFALIIPRSNPNSVLINLVVGAVSEAGALQAGDMLQDLKTGHLLAASPRAQFHGQMIGSFVGAIASAAIYKLYTSVYDVPGDLFQVPTGYVWIFTARLVTGKGLPPMAWEYAGSAALFFAGTSAMRIVAEGKAWRGFIPGGIAVAVGMYNTPSFTLARAIGGFISWHWLSHRQKDETTLIVLASGLILGEGLVSIVNLGLASFGVKHL